MKRFTADFETATWKKDETWVWAWAMCEIGNESNLKIGNNIETFIDYVKENKNSYVYFHNLKFDGEFIIYYLETNGYKHVTNKEDIEDKTYETLISHMGQFYSITVYFKKRNKQVHKITFFDSLKIIPFSVDKIAKSFNLPISKLKIDYNKPRKKGYKLNKEEIEYIKNDVLIVANALNVLFNENLEKMTQGSNAMHDFKQILGINKFNHYFPKLNSEVDKEIRKSYKGGFTYLSPEYKEKDVGSGVVLDVNSLYPSVMYEKKIPFGEPISYEGKYVDDKVYDLFIQTITCSFELKKNKIPTIQLKNRIGFIGNEYLTSSKNEIICLVLTSVDLKLFLEQYDVYDLQYHYGWKFKSTDIIFKDYIDKWIKRKIDATIEGNDGQRTLAKLMLNSLYGKLATSSRAQSKIPFLGEDNIIHYALGEEEEKDTIYIPAGSFITSYAREKTIRTSQAIMDYSIDKYGYNKYVYSDTDSIHCLLDIEELKNFCEIHPTELGKWAHESSFTKARFVRQKCYIEYEGEKINITCAGMPKNCYDKVTWENFKTGFTCGGKLTFKHVKGGVILVETDYTIKEQKVKSNIKNFKGE